MPRCDRCGKETRIRFECSYCGRTFCVDHRLPPSHQCINEKAWRDRAAGPKNTTTAAKQEDLHRRSPSMPAAECSFPGCGMKTSRLFFCPVCGLVFCDEHKLHRDHAPGKPAEPEKAESATTGPPKKPVDWPVVAALVIIALILGGILLAGMFQGGTKKGTAAGGCVTVITPTPTLPVTPKQYVISTTSTTEQPVTSAAAPETGTFITGSPVNGGAGDLTVDNTGGSSDVVAVLTKHLDKKTLFAVYIRRGDLYTTGGVRDGTYDLYISTGGNWNFSTKQFSENPSYQEFEDPLPFTTSGKQFTAWNVVIYPTVYGNAETTTVTPDDFPPL